MAQAFIARGARLWFVARALLMIVSLSLGMNPFEAAGGSAIQIVLVSVALCFFDVHRRRERVLIENLGVSRTTLAVVFAIPAIVGELAASIVFGVVA